MEKALAACVPNSLCPFWIDRDKPQLHAGQPGCSTCCLKGYKELVFCSFSGTVWRPGKRTEEFIQHPKRSSRDVSNSGTQILHYHLFPRLGQLHYQFPMNVFTSFHTWAIESQCRWPTKQCDLEILGLKSVKTQNLKPQKKIKKSIWTQKCSFDFHRWITWVVPNTFSAEVPEVLLTSCSKAAISSAPAAVQFSNAACKSSRYLCIYDTSKKSVIHLW